MNEVYLMDRLNGQDSFCNIKTTRLFTQDIFSHKERHEITTRQKVHDQVQILVILKAVLQINNPRVLGLDEYFPFGLDVVDLVFIDHLCLLHPLDRYNLARLNMPANSDLAKGSSANDGQWLEVPRRYLLPHLPIQLCLLVENVLLDQLLLGAREVQLLHLVLQDIPRLLPVALILLELLVF